MSELLSAVARMAAILATLPEEERPIARERLAEVSESPAERGRRLARDRKRKQRDLIVTQSGQNVTSHAESRSGHAPVTPSHAEPRASDSLSDLSGISSLETSEISPVTGSPAVPAPRPADPMGDKELAAAYAEGIAEGLGTRIQPLASGGPLRALCEAAHAFLVVPAGTSPMRRQTALAGQLRATAAAWARERKGEVLNEWKFSDWLKSGRPAPGWKPPPQQRAPATGRTWVSATDAPGVRRTGT